MDGQARQAEELPHDDGGALQHDVQVDGRQDHVERLVDQSFTVQVPGAVLLTHISV